MAKQERDSAGTRIDNVVGRLFRPSLTSQLSSANPNGQDVLISDTGFEETSADQYKHTFGKSRGGTASSSLTSAQLSLPNGQESQQHERTGRRSDDVLSPWPAQEMADSNRMDQAYSTPLTPRIQERERRAAASSRRDDSESGRASGLEISSPDPISFHGLDRQGTPERPLSPRRKRSASLGDVFGSTFPNSQKGYRQMEKALEAERQQQQRATSSLSASSATHLPTIPVPTLIVAGPSRNTFDAMPLSDEIATVDIPRRSSSRGRARRLSLSARNPTTSLQTGLSENRAGVNVTFRSRAVSAPSTSHDAGLLYTDASEQQSRGPRLQKMRALDTDQDKVYQPARARPLSLPIVAAPRNSAAANRASVGATSLGVASSMMIPLDPTLSTALTLRNPAGMAFYDNYQGISTSTRPSLSRLLRNRAQARYHLSALSAMRPRLPAQPWSELASLQYKSRLLLLHYTFLCIITYFHVVATVFFDYNTIYSTVQVAVYPDSPGANTAWWIAIGIYSAALLFWLVGVVVLWEIVIQYYRRWTNPRPFALPIYLSSSAFTLTSIQSYSLYSLLFRVRLSADPRDFLIETFWFYSHNWPTVLTLLPRGIILTVFLVLYSPYSTSMKVPLNGEIRDTVYFSPTTGLMKSFSFIILLVNVIWMAWRLIILFAAYLGLFFTLGPKAMFQREKTSYDWSDNNDILTPKQPNVALSRGKASQRPFSSDLPLLSSPTEGQYSSSEAQGFISPDREMGMAFDSQERSMPGQKVQNRALITNIQFPRWAWRARAEDRIKSLLFESSMIERTQQNASSSTAWPPFHERGEGEPSGVSLVSAPEMEEVSSSRRKVSQAGPPTFYHAQLADKDVEMEILSSPVREQHESEPRSSQYIDATAIRAPFVVEALAAAAPLPMAIAAVAGGETTPSRSRVSSTSQQATIQNRGERRGRLSSSSEVSMYTDPMSRVSTDSRFSAVRGQENERIMNGVGGDDNEMEDPLSSSSGDRTPTSSYKDGMDQNNRALPPSPLANAISDADNPASSKSRRASSSLSSLAESLRFMRSNRSVDKVDSGSSDVNRSKERLVKSDGAWWSSLSKGRTKSSGNGTDSTTPLLEEQEVVQEASSQEPKIESEPILEQAKNKEREAGQQERIEEEQASIQTHETTSTDDSEERKLWSQFPEQSRRHPPGMTAYEYEQKRLSQEEERRLSGEVGEPSSLLEEDESAHSQGSHRSEGPRPIKEESWSSSLESASNDSRS